MNAFDLLLKTNHSGFIDLNPRFKSFLELKYPFNNVEKSEVSKDKLLLYSTIFNLAGALGILPLSVREELVKRHREKDDSLADFIDIFNSRSIDFLVAIQCKRDLGANSHIQSKLSSLALILRSIVGFNGYDLGNNSYVGISFYVFFAGFFSARIRNRENLQQMLAYYLGVPVDVEMFGQGWENIDEKFQGKLSLDRNSGSVLGENMILGKRVKMYQRQCRISIGPLDESRFQDFLPGGVWLNRVKEIVRVYWNNSVSVDLKLIRIADSIGPSFLGLKSFLKKLGKDTWVFSRNLPNNRNDCHFKLLEIGSFQ